MSELAKYNSKEDVPDIDLSDSTVPAELASRSVERTASQERALAKQYREMQSLYLGLRNAWLDLQEDLERQKTNNTFAGIGQKRRLFDTDVGYFREFDL